MPTVNRRNWTLRVIVPLFGIVQLLFFIFIIKLTIFTSPNSNESDTTGLERLFKRIPKSLSESKSNQMANFPEALTLSSVLAQLEDESSKSKNTNQKEEGTTRKKKTFLKSPKISNEILSVPVKLAKTNFIVNNYICGNWSRLQRVDSKLISNKNKSILLILVHSQRGNLREREVIRNTYGSVKSYKGLEIKIVFLLGKGSGDGSFDRLNPFLHIRLAWEITTHSDIIMGNFKESKDSSIYKHVMGYRWAVRLCQFAKYLIKVEDDNFVDIFEIIDTTIPKMVLKNGTFYCSSRRGISGSRFDSELSILPYCSGEGYLITMDGAKKLFSMVIRVPVIGNDDAFVTGILRKEYLKKKPSEKLKIIHQEHLLNVENDKCEFTKSPRLIGERLSFHKIIQRESLVNDAWCLWKNALEAKNLLNTQVQRFILSTLVA